MRDYFLQTERLKFSNWQEGDLALAELLWASSEVTHFLSANGKFSDKQIIDRLHLEISNQRNYQRQYWPIFERSSEELIGCSGLRPLQGSSDICEFGIHLRKEFWGKGYGEEAGRAVIAYAYDELGVKEIVAGHHPQNLASKKLLEKLSFSYQGLEFYSPTGLYHPAYYHKKNYLSE